jgi:hypothetical protein
LSAIPFSLYPLLKSPPLSFHPLLQLYAREAWLQIDVVCFFKEQHRFNVRTEGGKRLWEIVQLAWALRRLTNTEMDLILETLQVTPSVTEWMVLFSHVLPPLTLWI